MINQSQGRKLVNEILTELTLHHDMGFNTALHALRGCLDRINGGEDSYMVLRELGLTRAFILTLVTDEDMKP